MNAFSTIKKYKAFFRLRFVMGLQYRAAAAAGIVTQFFWGFMLIIAFSAFYESDPSAFPMSFQDTITYVWLQQAFLALFNTWMMENEIFDTIAGGNIAYELCRPIRIYNMWIARSLANRFSRAVLRCSPILIVAFLIPEPYRMVVPPSLGTFLLFVLSLILGTAVATAFCMIVYGLTFFTISPQGVRVLFASLVDFLAGGVIPIPFLPDKVRAVVELLPFASMQNAPLRIYSGSLSSSEINVMLGLQFFWLIALVLIGSALCRLAEHKACIQGG